MQETKLNTNSKIEVISNSKNIQLDEMTPSLIVKELDKYIIGQYKAKRAVAIAIRNRVRRRKIEGDLQDEIHPKNIIMIGPTGCGKTEIARRLSKLAGAPFVKVEATKYTEVGYVGRDVESMIRDLINASVTLVQKEFRESVQKQAEAKTYERLLELLLPHEKEKKTTSPTSSNKYNINPTDLNLDNASSITPLGLKVTLNMNYENEAKNNKENDYDENNDENNKIKKDASDKAREFIAKKLNNLELEDKEVEIETSSPMMPMVQVMSGGPNIEEMDLQIQNMLGDLMPKRSKRKRVTVAYARKILLEEELERLVDADKVREEAIRRTEQMGIIFIDELDKICSRNSSSGGSGEVSREGVQRDLLPIVEGSSVNTRYGTIKTDHILFIAAGAFHTTNPSDLIPELQGRFPIRVELDKLSKEDFIKILTTPKNSLVKQAYELLKTENVEIEFKSSALEELAHFAYEVNEKTENIGARRLHTLLEHLLDEISFDAPDLPEDKRKIIIDSEFVKLRLNDIVKDRDLSKYIL